MITQRIPTLASLLLLPLAIPTGLAATVPARPGHSAEATVQVTNDNHQTVNVILVGGQGWHVLGLVGSNATRVFDMPRDLVGMEGVTVLADPLEDLTGFQSKPITTRTGREVNLLVTSPATHSLLTVG